MESTTLTAQEARQKLDETKHRNVPFEEKAQEALHIGEQYLGANNGYLTRIDMEADYWEATVSTASQDGQFPAGHKLDLETTYSRRTIAEDRPITLHDAPTQGWEDDPAFETHGINFYHGTPLYLDGQPYGTICFVANEPRDEAFETDETMFADLIRRLLEQELERQQLQAELTRRTNLVNVLNRVIRHNMRNEMSVIRGQTKRMVEQLEDSVPTTAALENIDEIIQLGEKAQEVEEIVHRNHDRRKTNLETLIGGVVADVSSAFPAAAVTLTVDANGPARVLPSFERAVRELVENAAKHSGTSPSVTVTVEHGPQTIDVRIADTGPGLSDQEREVLKSGVETPLVHGSGLGLWIVQWILASHDGTVEATVTDTGTTMTLSVPRMPATDGTQDLVNLSQARDQYQAAFEESFEAKLLLDDQARIIEANPAVEHIYGLEPAEIHGRTLTEFFPEEFDFDEALTTFQDNGNTREIVTVSGADGADRQVEYSITTDVVPGQNLLVGRDVTERRKRKANLESYETVLDSINDVVWVYDKHKRVTFSNQPNLDGVSISNEQLTGKPLSAFESLFADSETFERWEALIEDVLAGDVGADDLDVTFNVQDDPREMNLRVAPVPDSVDPTGVAVIATDVPGR